MKVLWLALAFWLALPVAAADAPPAREGRHALIIGLGRYQADPARPVEPLHGVVHDMKSARTMAELLQVPAANVVELRDEAATRARITDALATLAQRVQPGDRVFLYWSGHGSRFHDARENACVETLIPYDLKDFSFREFAQLIKPIGDKADKLFVVYDACHSGGAQQGVATRSVLGDFRPKTSGVSTQCSQPSNVRTRSFESAVSAAGMGLGDVVHIASARPDEVSFDNAQAGGLATQSLLACMKGGARDLDGNGAITADELVQCAQGRLETMLAPHPQLMPHHFTLAGNRRFVPQAFAQAPASAAPAAPAAPTTAARPPAVTPVPPVPPTTAADLLTQLHAQRDHKRDLRVATGMPRLRIGRDALDLSITSPQAGHVYVAMAGSDGQALTLLFPNDIDRDNRIAAGQTLLLPRPAWRLQAAGPAGRDRLLVMVSDGPRDLAALQAGGKAGPFARTLLDAQGRARVQWLLGQRSGACAAGERCGDAFAAALLDLEEY